MTTSPQPKPDSSPPLNSENSLRFSVRRILQAVTFYGLLVIVVAAAIPYGEVNSPVQLIYASFIYLLCAGRAIEGLLDGSLAFADKMLVFPVIGILVLAALQVLPLPLLSSINGATPQGNQSISLDRYATVNFVLILGSLVVLGDTLLHLTNTRKRLIAVCATVLLVGVGSALFGIGRHALMGAGDALPIEVVDVAPAQYAQFINRNHFALLVEMTLGILLGLLLKARLSSRWNIVFGTAIALCWVSTISANSRGGIGSSAGVIILAVFAHFVTRTSNHHQPGDSPATRSRARRLGTVFAVAAITAVLSGALIVSVALIGGETTVSRFETTNRDFDTVDGRASRLEIWHSTMRLVAAFPFLGSGFGAYARAITPYDTASGGDQIIRQAHNEYLEIAAAGGVVGAFLALLFTVLLVRRIVQRFNDRSHLEKAIGFGAAVGMAGVMLHSLVDFGLHVQINSLVFVLLIVLATAEVERRTRRRSEAYRQTQPAI